MGGSKLKAFPHLPQVKEREKEWEESRRGIQAYLMGCSRALKSLPAGWRGPIRRGQICFRVSEELINYEQTLLSLIGRTKLHFVSSPRPLGSLQLTTGQKF